MDSIPVMENQIMEEKGYFCWGPNSTEYILCWGLPIDGIPSIYAI